MHFGFSYVGLIYLLMLFIPNIKWAKNKPEDYDVYAGSESRILLAFERVGQVLTSVIVLIFSDFNLRRWTPWCLWLILSFSLMILYECYWHRYFKSEKTMRDQYGQFCGFPVAGATLPVLAFLFLGIYGVNIWLIIATVILGIGHIGIHKTHEKEVNGPKAKKHIVRRVLKFAGIVLLTLVFTVIFFFIGVRNLNFTRHQMNYKNGVDEQAYVALGGQEQYVVITGRDVSNPMVIYLHGGPASPDTMVMYTFADRLMDAYTIIGWDQRGAGRTWYNNRDDDPENQTASFEQALQDVDELVEYARERFHQEKVIIMGHSYGTILGSQYVLAHPEKVSDYIAVGQVVSASRGDLYSYEDALAKAIAAGDDTSNLVAAYETYMSNQTLKNMIALREPVSVYHPAERAADHVSLRLSSPYFGIDDARWFLKQVFSLEDYLALNSQLFDYIMIFDAFELEMNYQVPVHFISGSEDWVCPVDLIRDYYDSISAPDKSLTLIDGSGHAPQTDYSEEFADAVSEVLSK